LPQASIVSFNVKGVHAHDLSTIADSQQVQLRAGHHCAMPLLTRLKIYSSARISFGVYSCKEDIPPLIEAIRLAKRMFT
jgi:cysteine desulfurase/selenocysteine lyase